MASLRAAAVVVGGRRRRAPASVAAGVGGGCRRRGGRCAAAASRGDDLRDRVVRPPGRQRERRRAGGGSIEIRLSPVVDEAELVARRLLRALRRSAGDRPRAAARALASSRTSSSRALRVDVVLLAQPRLHGQHEQRREQRADDAERRAARAPTGCPRCVTSCLLERDRPGEVAATPTPPAVRWRSRRPRRRRCAPHGAAAGSRSSCGRRSSARPVCQSSSRERWHLARDRAPPSVGVSAARARRVRGTRRSRRAAPRSAAAGCTWRRGRCAPGRRS